MGGRANRLNKPVRSERSLWVVDPKLTTRLALLEEGQRLTGRFLARLRRETAVEVLKLVGGSRAHPRQALLALAADFDLDGFLDRAGFACVMEELGSGKEKRVVALWLIRESSPGQSLSKQAGRQKRRGPVHAGPLDSSLEFRVAALDTGAHRAHAADAFPEARVLRGG